MRPFLQQRCFRGGFLYRRVNTNALLVLHLLSECFLKVAAATINLILIGLAYGGVDDNSHSGVANL